jgi:hypothetical protein
MSSLELVCAEVLAFALGLVARCSVVSSFQLTISKSRYARLVVEDEGEGAVVVVR